MTMPGGVMFHVSTEVICSILFIYLSAFSDGLP
jgi:hypothetical protein